MKEIKAINKINPIVGAFDTIQQLANGNQEHRQTAMTWKDDKGNIVDTVIPTDTQTWETAIERKDVEGKWVIVEQYKTKEEAIKGHKKWIDKIKKAPRIELNDIDVWGLND